MDMVKLNVPYEMNHIYKIVMEPGDILINDAEEILTEDLELFARSLALASDLKRLPLLRSATCHVHFDANTLENLAASGVETLTAEIFLRNDRTVDIAPLEEEVLIYTWEAVASLEGGIPFFSFPNHVWPFRGGILLNNQISVQVNVTLDGPVAGANLDAGYMNLTVFLEVDWLPVSKKQFEEFLLESVYAQE